MVEENVKTENNKEVTTEVPAKAVFRLPIIRSLIRDYHCKVVDIKQNKVDPTKVVVFFEDGIYLRDSMQKIVKERKKRFAEERKERNEKPEQED